MPLRAVIDYPSVLTRIQRPQTDFYVESVMKEQRAGRCLDDEDRTTSDTEGRTFEKHFRIRMVLKMFPTHS